LTSFGEQVRIATTGDLAVDTIKELGHRYEQLRPLNEAANQFIKQLREAELSVASTQVDLVSVLEDARDSVAAAYERWRAATVNAAQAPLLAEVTALHERLDTICSLVREQEADQDKALPGEFTGPDDLFAAMGI
jgi:hypothetical protein